MKKRIYFALLIFMMLFSGCFGGKWYTEVKAEEASDDSDNAIYAFAIPENGSDSTHLVCGSSMQLLIRGSEGLSDTEQSGIRWEVIREDTKETQAVYEEIVSDKGEWGIRLYAPYNQPESLIIRAYSAGQTDAYEYRMQTIVRTGVTESTYFKFDTGINANAEIKLSKETWDCEVGRYKTQAPKITNHDSQKEFVGWLGQDNHIYPAGAGIESYDLDFGRTHETLEALWIYNNGDVTRKAVKIIVDWSSVPKNGSSVHHLIWGSGMGLYAVAILEDGSVAVAGTKEILWEISDDDGKTVQAVIRDITEQKEWSKISLYVPVGYEENMTIRAVSAENPGVWGSYAMKVTAAGPYFREYDDKTWFRFYVNAPDGLQVSGDEPVFEEKWDRESMSYSVVMPECSYQIEGLEFQGWLGMDGALHQPGETLTINKRDYGSYFSVYAFWKDLNPPKPPASVKITQVKRTSSKKATVKWKKISGAEGYEITYSVKSSFKSAKVKTVSKNKASCVIKGLKKNKVYYVKIRAYKTDKVGRKISGAYSKVKKIKNE